MHLFLWKHDDVIKWKYYLRYWPFVRGIHWSPASQRASDAENVYIWWHHHAIGITLTIMMTSSNGDIFRVTGHLCGEFTGPGEFPHKGQWRGALKFSFICVWINGWVNNGEACDLRRHRPHYDIIVMWSWGTLRIYIIRNLSMPRIPD